jgi:hypothetical protein
MSSHCLQILSVIGKFAVAFFTGVLAWVTTRQANVMKGEFDLRLRPSVLVRVPGVFKAVEPSTQTPVPDKPLTFSLLNVSEHPIVFINAHLLKWDARKRLGAKQLARMQFGLDTPNWVVPLDPADFEPEQQPGNFHGIVVEPARTLTLKARVGVAEANYRDFLSWLVKTESPAALLVLVLAYPTAPGGTVFVGVPIEFTSISQGGDAGSKDLVGEMILNGAAYAFPLEYQK